MIPQAIVERVARAICAARGLDWDAQADPMRSAGGGEEEQRGFLDDATAALSASPLEEMVEAGQFLVDRLSDIDGASSTPDEFVREFYGHVEPAFARFRSALTRLSDDKEGGE